MCLCERLFNNFFEMSRHRSFCKKKKKIVRFEIRLKIKIKNDNICDHFNEHDFSYNSIQIEIANENMLIFDNLNVFDFNSCFANINSNAIKSKLNVTRNFEYNFF